MTTRMILMGTSTLITTVWKKLWTLFGKHLLHNEAELHDFGGDGILRQ
jgi:hypothetical protein